MPSISPASSAAERPTLVVAALSARALARAADLSGCTAIALDLFADQDTREMALEARALPGSLENGLEAEALLGAIDDILASSPAPPDGLVYGAGFEDRPALLAAISERLPLLGNAPETVRRVKDPRDFFPALRRLAVAYPEVSLDRPAEAGPWLAKRIGASGGSHILAGPGDAPEPDHYFQRRVEGRAVSALFLADGRAAEIVGLSEQWASPGESGAGFRYGGAVQPAAVPAALRAEIDRAVAALVPVFGLKGLNSADFLLRARDLDLLEVNPRPGGTLDVFESGALFARHLAACRGARLSRALRHDGSDGAKAVAVVYAPQALDVPAGFAWPAWAADLPPAGTSVPRDAPLCSVLADAPAADTAQTRVKARAAEILARLRDGDLARGAVA